MSLVAPKPTSSRPLAPEGTHVAICYSMIDLGTHEDTGKFGTKRQRKIRLSFELCTELHVFKEEEGEQPFTVHNDFTFSMGEKANLRKFLTNWRGKAFTEEEANAFDVSKLLGVPALLTVMHVTKGDKTYTNIGSALKLPKAMAVPVQANPRVEFSLAEFDEDTFQGFPDWLQQKIANSDEYKAMRAGPAPGSKGYPDPKDEDDDIPF